MKNNRTIITLIGALAAVMVIFGFSNQKDTEGKILILRTCESITRVWDNSITIVYEDGKLERTEFDNISMKDTSTNLTIINKKLNEIDSKGYDLIATSQSSMEGNVITTYTFQKE